MKYKKYKNKITVFASVALVLIKIGHLVKYLIAIKTYVF